MSVVAAILGVLVSAGCGGVAARAAGTGATVKVVKTYPHDPTLFTEGLVVVGDAVYESSGLYGTSSARKTSLKSGRVLASASLPASLFAEGLAIGPDGKLVQLTWREKTAIVRDAKTLKELKRFAFDGEGWGLCYSASSKAFVQTDGTANLTLRDPKTFGVVKTLAVTSPDGTAPVNLNEAECVKDRVFVNVWLTKTILEISLRTGRVERTIDASVLGPTSPASPDDVLNGIAALPNGNLLLTGKRWPLSYEVAVVDSAALTSGAAG